MTVTFNPVQTASIVLQTVDTTTINLPASTSPFQSAALFRFQLSLGLYLFDPVALNATITSVSGAEEFYVLLLEDPSAISSLSNGALPPNLIPSTYSSLWGTAPSYELARKTILSPGTISFPLDLTILTRFFSAATSPTKTWNGSLLLWLCARQSSLGTWSTSATLTADHSIDYPNRRTGGPGIQSSRYTTCPISGQLIPEGEMVLDGYRNILVHPDNYDPPEPEPREWDDYPDPNREGA